MKTGTTSTSYNMLNSSKSLTNTFHGVDRDLNSLGGTIYKKRTKKSSFLLKILVYKGLRYWFETFVNKVLTIRFLQFCPFFIKISVRVTGLVTKNSVQKINAKIKN